MTRLEAMQRVVDAALKWWGNGKPYASFEDTHALTKACEALDALPAAPTQGETVDVAVWRADVEYRFSPMTLQASRVLVGAGYSLLGTTLLPIRATVATEGGGE